MILVGIAGPHHVQKRDVGTPSKVKCPLRYVLQDETARQSLVMLRGALTCMDARVLAVSAASRE